MVKNKVWWKTKRARHVGLIALGVSLLSIVIWFIAFYPYVSTDDARIAMTFVRIAPSDISGRVKKLNVQEGSLVKKGDLLIEIDHRIPQAEEEKAKAKADQCMRELARLERLASAGAATAQAREQAKANADIAQAELKLAQLVLENTYLKSPFDGVIVQKSIDEGGLLEENQVALVVADEAHAWIAANIEETSVGPIKIGQPVQIEVDEGGSLEGVVSEVRYSVAAQFALIPSDSGSGNFTKVVQRVPIKIAITKRNNLPLRAGQSVEIKIRVR